MNRRYIITAAAVTLLLGLLVLGYWCLHREASRGSAASPPAPGQLGVSVDPSGIAVDIAGNLYVSAQKQNLVLKVSPSWWRVHAGAVTVAAGTGNLGFGGNGGPSGNALLAAPEGLAVDSAGNLFIADTGNNRIRPRRRRNPGGLHGSGKWHSRHGNRAGRHGLAALRTRLRSCR